MSRPEPTRGAIVYVLYCLPIDQYYVGSVRFGAQKRSPQGLLNYRWAGHVRDSIHNHGPSAAIRIYGKESFRKTIAFQGTVEACHRIEEFLINELNSFLSGMNKSSSGRNRGMKHSEETLRRIGYASSKKVMSTTARRLISEASKAMWQDTAKRAGMLAARQGRKLTSEHKRKISEARLKRNRPHE